jgi:flagellar hook-associated protein 1 FlgK
MVFLEGHMLVGSQGSIPLETQIDGDGNLQPMWSDDGTIAAVSAGEMGATRKLREWALNEVLPDLNNIASELIDAVNSLHTSGFTLDNNPGGDFFSGSDAHDIDLSALVASDLNAIVTAAGPDSPGDGSIALQMADLQEEHRAALGDSIVGAYATMTALLGLNVQQSDTMAGNQEALVGFLTDQRDSLAGVSLDEEGITMIGAQRAYEAAARVITVVDEMLDQLINRTGMVGR